MKRTLDELQQEIGACIDLTRDSHTTRKIARLRDKLEVCASLAHQMHDKLVAVDDGPYLTTIKYECGNAYTTLKEDETMPSLALDFLNLVEPVIEVTLAKHTYVHVHFDTLLYDVGHPGPDDDVEYYVPEEWEAKGDGRWHASIFGDEERTRAWNYYCAHRGEPDCDEKTLELYGEEEYTSDA